MRNFKIKIYELAVKIANKAANKTGRNLSAKDKTAAFIYNYILSEREKSIVNNQT